MKRSSRSSAHWWSPAPTSPCNTISFGLKVLTDFPEQRRLLLADLPGRIDPAALQMARWVSPVASFVRRATRRHRVGWQEDRCG